MTPGRARIIANLIAKPDAYMFVHPQFDPIAIQIGPLAVRWYGLMYLIGFVIAMLLGRYRIRTQPALGNHAA